MSISTRIHGFTAWINLRLSNSSGQLLDNVLVDLLKGYNMKILLESKIFCGKVLQLPTGI